MEILIIGLFLVALMVYASTRIKRTAAEAFNAERIETDDFIIEKPDGFLNVLNHDPSLEFDAYSKEFGADDASGFRAARAELTKRPETLDRAAKEIKAEIEAASDVSEIVDGHKYRVLEGRSDEKGIAFREIYKLVEKDGHVFAMKLKMLVGVDADIIKRAELMLASFEIK